MVLIRGVQQLYYQNVEVARTLFFKLSQNNESDNVYQQACIGLAFTEALQTNDYRISTDDTKSTRTQDDALVFMVPRVFARIWTMDNVNGTLS